MGNCAGTILAHYPLREWCVVLGGRRDFNDNSRRVFRFLAGVQRVVDRFPDGGQESSGRAVKTQQVAILGEELTDGDVFLLGRQLGSLLADAKSSPEVARFLVFFLDREAELLAALPTGL